MKSIFSDAYRQIVQDLIHSRKKAGLTQQQVADYLGRPQSFVAKYETNERRLDVVEFLRVCKLIKADYKKILSKVDQQKL